ncbi:MAG: hypothetical protein ACOC9W_04620, partial [Persicimonas sp.]
MAEKLHIPGPDEHEDFTELDVGIVYAWAVCMLIAIALFIFFRDRLPPEVPPTISTRPSKPSWLPGSKAR